MLQDMKEFKNKKIFVYKAKDIKRVISNNIDECSMDYELIDNDFLKDKYLIFENIGDGYAREYYSKLIFNLKIIGESNNIIYKNENQRVISLYNQYRKSLKIPLLVEIPNNIIFKNKLDSELKKVLQNNITHEYQIISTLKEIEIKTKEELKNSIDQIINKKYENILCLNYLEHLKKTR